jgi:hypothetical protein
MTTRLTPPQQQLGADIPSTVDVVEGPQLSNHPYIMHISVSVPVYTTNGADDAVLVRSMCTIKGISTRTDLEL